MSRETGAEGEHHAQFPAPHALPLPVPSARTRPWATTCCRGPQVPARAASTCSSDSPIPSRTALMIFSPPLCSAQCRMSFNFRSCRIRTSETTCCGGDPDKAGQLERKLIVKLSFFVHVAYGIALLRARTGWPSRPVRTPAAATRPRRPTRRRRRACSRAEGSGRCPSGTWPCRSRRRRSAPDLLRSVSAAIRQSRGSGWLRRSRCRPGRRHGPCGGRSSRSIR